MADVERVDTVRGLTGKAEPSFLAIASWLGLVVGLAEVGMLLVGKYRNQVATIGALRLNRHYPWMVPASTLAIFAAFGLLMELSRRIKPSLTYRLGPTALGALALSAVLMTIRGLNTIACVLLACGVASQLVPRLGRFGPGFRRVVRVSLPALLAGLVVLVVGRHVQFIAVERLADSRPVAKGSPNVLLLVLDTVRAKSLGLYGYPRDTTPRLARLAARGVAFSEARAAAPWTLPSHASLLTGRWPSELFEHPESRFDPSATTLAEFLGRHGYATGGFVANTFYCNSGFGMGRGFDHYEDFYEKFDISIAEVVRHSGMGKRLVDLIAPEEEARPDGHKDADRINGDFLTWLSTKPGRPFFAFLNYIDAHTPYIAPPDAPRHFGLRPTTPDDFRVLADWHKLNVPPSDPRQVELARDAYDDCIAFLDERLGRLFDELDRRKLLDDTLVIVTSDHGEELGEHQLMGHGRSLYREELHVPLLVVKPGRVPSGRVVDRPVSLHDIPATVVDLLGLSDRSPFPGRSMAPLWSTDPGERSLAEAGVVRSEVALREKATTKKDRPPALRGPMIAIVAEGMSYIRNADGSEELYRLLDDPSEAKNLAQAEADRPTLERLRGIADRKGDPADARVTASKPGRPGFR